MKDIDKSWNEILAKRMDRVNKLEIELNEAGRKNKNLLIRISELEGALREAIDYIPDNKLFDRAKKALGGGE